jgi:hypothetical protein
LDGPTDVSVIYIRRDEGGWTLDLTDQKHRFTTATGAIYVGIQEGRALARTGREVWVLWQNGEAWSVAWTSDADRNLLDSVEGGEEGRDTDPPPAVQA